jgi:hypothetical protein
MTTVSSSKPVQSRVLPVNYFPGGASAASVIFGAVKLCFMMPVEPKIRWPAMVLAFGGFGRCVFLRLEAEEKIS